MITNKTFGHGTKYYVQNDFIKIIYEFPTQFFKQNTVKPRFWNTFPAKIYVINKFFAADQNS